MSASRTFGTSLTRRTLLQGVGVGAGAALLTAPHISRAAQTGEKVFRTLWYPDFQPFPHPAGGGGGGYLAGMGWFDGLILMDPATDFTTLKPGVAESWERSSDGRTWTFQLRESMWSNGDPLTAHDFVFGFQYRASPNFREPVSPFFADPYLENWDDVQLARQSPDALGVRAVDDYTLEFKLRRPAASDFEWALAVLGAIPVHRQNVEQYQAEWAFPPHGVSNGPYYMSRWEAQRETELLPNPHYWGDPPLLDRIILRHGDFVNFPAYEAGDVDLAYLGPPELPVAMQREGEFQAVSMTVYKHLHRRHTRNTALDDVRVRQALAHAIDKRTLADSIYFGQVMPTDVLTLEGMIGHDPAAGLEYDPDKARQLLERAGVRAESLRVALNANSGYNPPDNQAIVAMWNALGVQAEQLVEEPGVYWSKYNHIQADDIPGYWFSSDLVGPLHPRFIWIDSYRQEMLEFMVPKEVELQLAEFNAEISSAQDQATQVQLRNEKQTLRDQNLDEVGRQYVALLEQIDSASSDEAMAPFVTELHTLEMEQAIRIPTFWEPRWILARPEFTGIKLIPYMTGWFTLRTIAPA